MSTTVLIRTTPRAYELKVDEDGFIIGTRVNVHGYMQKFVERKYDYMIRRWKVLAIYRLYNHETQTLYVPRFDLDDFIDFLESRGLKAEIREKPLSRGVKVNIPMQPWFKPKHALQAGGIAHITDPAVGPVRSLGMWTGKGKTATFIAGVAQSGVRGMIRASGMLDQWKGAVKKFTQLKDEDIYVISGSASLFKLIRKIDKEIFPKFIISSNQTLRSYMFIDKETREEEKLPPIDELMDVLGVGMVGVDEVHTFFHMNLILDLVCNAAVMVPMTATFEIEDITPIAAAVFDRHFPKSTRFGEGIFDPYTHVTCVYFSLAGPTSIPFAKFNSSDGYNHAKFEAWLLKPKNLFYLVWMIDHVYFYIINQFYLRKRAEGQKMVILVTSTQMAEFLVEKIKKKYPDVSTGLYISGVTEKVRDTYDIIVSNRQMAGTGRDIPDLLTVYNSVAVASSPQNKQNLGRLRELESHTPEFVFSACKGITKQVDYAEKRERIFRPLALKYETIHVS